MMFPDSKNVTFVEILLCLNSSTKSSGLPDFYSVKLDVIGFQQKLHFWNRRTSYINALYSDSIPNSLETYQSFKDAVYHILQRSAKVDASGCVNAGAADLCRTLQTSDLPSDLAQTTAPSI